jgi:hypothetical protein
MVKGGVSNTFINFINKYMYDTRVVSNGKKNQGLLLSDDSNSVKTLQELDERILNGEIYKSTLYKFKDENYDKRKSDNNLFLKKYIEILYKYLNAIDLCFIDGSFVIEDKPNTDISLLGILAFSSSVNLKEFSSHDAFTPEKYEIKPYDNEKMVYTCEKVCESHIKSKLNKTSVKITCLKSDSNENEISRIIKNAIWYKFTRNGRTFVFLKLEEVKNRFYKFLKIKSKELFKKGGRDLTKRLQNCGDECMFKINTADFKSKNTLELLINVNFSLNNTDKTVISENRYDCNKDEYKGVYKEYKVKVEDEYGRIGDEFFIPLELNDFFINYAKYGRINIDDIIITKKLNTVYIYIKDDCIETIIQKKINPPQYQPVEKAWAGGKNKKAI